MGDVFAGWNDFNESPIGQIGLAVLNYYVPGAGFAIQAGVSFADTELNGGGNQAGDEFGAGGFAEAGLSRTIAVRQPIAYRKFVYGSVRIGGNYTFIHQTDSNRKHHYVFTLAGHVVDSADNWELYANGIHVPLDGNGEPVVGNKYRNYIQVYFGDGTVAGDADLQAALVANTAGGWTASDRQRQRAKAYVYIKAWSNSVFESGIPAFSFGLRGKRLFDPRVAGKTITSSGAGAEPLITTGTAHGVVAGDMVFIQGHTGSTPAIGGFYEVLSAPTTTTCTLQLYGGGAVTVTGTGGTLHKCVWSDNAALVICDYLITPSRWGGFGADYATEIDESLLITAANACDNRVSVGGEKINIASVDTGADTIDLATAKPVWATGDGVLLQTTGTLPSPLAVDTTYYIVKTDDDTVQIATSIENAFGESTYDTGTVTVTNGDATVVGVGTAFTADVSPGDRFVRDGDGVSYEVDSVTNDTTLELTENYDGVTGSGVDYEITLIDTPVTVDITDTGTGSHSIERIWSAVTVDTATDEITLSQDELAWLLGDTVEFQTAGTMPTPIAASTDYFVLPIAGSPNKIKIATSRANAVDGTVVNITGSGSGRFYIRRTEEARYTASGVLSTEPSIKKNFEELISAIVGDLVYVGGVYKIYAGVWRAPTETITGSDFISPIRMETGLPRSKHINTVKGLYIGPASVNQLDDYPPVVNETALAEDDGETFAGEVNFPFTPSPTAASRGARILLRRAGLEKTIAADGKLKLWKHEPPDVVSVTYARLGLSASAYQISDATLSIKNQDGAPYVGYDLVMRETAATVFDHDPDDEATAGPPQTAVPPSFIPPAPTSLGFTPTNFDISTGGGVLYWTASDDGFVESGGSYKVSISADAGVTYTPVAISTGTQVDLSGLVPGNYTASVVAVAASAVGAAESEPATFALVIASPSVLPQVSGLELRGDGANSAEFTGTAAKFVWRSASVQGAYEIGAEPNGGDDGYIDPYFKDYEVRILKTDGTLLRVEHTIDAFWDYTFEKNAEDYFNQEAAAGAYRTFVVEVYQRGNQNQISPKAARMTVANPAPAALDGVSLTVKFNEIALLFTSPGDLDWQGVIVWISETPGFTPSDANKFGEFAKTQNPIFIEADPDTTFYIRAAAFDAFGKTGLNQTSELSTTTGTAGTEYFSSISADIITTGTLQSGETIDVGAESLRLDGTNRFITVTDTQGSPVLRVKLGKLGAGASDYGLQLFDSSGNEVLGLDGLGLDVVGTANIADGVITAAKIDDATITAAKIADATITGAKIDDATITGAKIGTATIDTINMADGSITNVASNNSAANTALGLSESTVLSQAITSEGGEVVVIARVLIKQTTNGANQVRVRLKLGATVKDEKIVNVTLPTSTGGDEEYVSFSFVETPGSGSKTYSITCQAQPYGGGLSGGVQARSRAIFELEALK